MRGFFCFNYFVAFVCHESTHVAGVPALSSSGTFLALDPL